MTTEVGIAAGLMVIICFIGSATEKRLIAIRDELRFQNQDQRRRNAGL